MTPNPSIFMFHYQNDRYPILLHICSNYLFNKIIFY
jgi:hypothetical protein